MSGIVESLHNAVNAGLHVKQDWVDMGFGIADTVAKIVDQVLKSLRIVLLDTFNCLAISWPLIYVSV